MENNTCMQCHKEFTSMPFTCKFCKSSHCIDHQLPENHNCVGLAMAKERQLESLKGGNPDRPVEYFYGRWKRAQLKIFYYAILLAITMLAIFVVARILI